MDWRKIFPFMRFWPPFLGAGIKMRWLDASQTTVQVEMNLRFWNRNFVGTHYGGSLYSMCDPFLMLILMQQLGPNYIVWDKEATIRFIKPGKGRVKAVFHIPEKLIEEFRSQLEVERKIEPCFKVEIIDDDGTKIAEVDKTLYLRKKK